MHAIGLVPPAATVVYAATLFYWPFDVCVLCDGVCVRRITRVQQTNDGLVQTLWLRSFILHVSVVFFFFLNITFIQFNVYVECIVISSLQFTHICRRTPSPATIFIAILIIHRLVKWVKRKHISYWITFWPFRSGYLYAMVLNMRLIDELMTVRRQ